MNKFTMIGINCVISGLLTEFVLSFILILISQILVIFQMLI